MWSINGALVEHKIMRAMRWIVDQVLSDPMMFVFGCQVRIFL